MCFLLLKREDLMLLLVYLWQNTWKIHLDFWEVVRLIFFPVFDIFCIKTVNLWLTDTENNHLLPMYMGMDSAKTADWSFSSSSIRRFLRTFRPTVSTFSHLKTAGNVYSSSELTETILQTFIMMIDIKTERRATKYLQQPRWHSYVSVMPATLQKKL